MLVHFPTRAKARAYATLGSKVVDNGPSSPVGKRWACEAVIAAKVADTAIAKLANKPVLQSLKKKTIVIINADKNTPDSNIEACFQAALRNWQDGKPKQNDKMSRHTARAELNALFSK